MGLELGPLGLDHLRGPGPAGRPHRGVGEERLHRLPVRRGRLARHETQTRVDHQVVEEGEHRPVDVAGADRLPLRLVAVQQRRIGLTLDHRSKLPREVVRVLDRGVQPQPGRRRVAVRGVTGQEHPADPVPVGEHALEDPVADLQHFQLEIRQLQQLLEPRDDRLLVEPLRVVGAEGEVEDPLLGVLAPGRTHRDHRPTAPRTRPVWVEEPRDETGLVRIVGQVGPEVRADHVEQSAGPLHRHAELLANRLAAVCGDHVSGAHLVGVAGGAILHRGSDASRVLDDGDEFVPEADSTRSALLGVPPQDRLEPDLRQVAREARAVGCIALVERPATEAVHRVERAGIQRAAPTEGGAPADLAEALQRRPDRVNRVRDPVLAEDLHRPLVQVVRLRQVRRRLVAFDEQRLHTQLGQEDRRCQPAAAATHDQNRNVHVGHRHLL